MSTTKAARREHSPAAGAGDDAAAASKRQRTASENDGATTATQPTSSVNAYAGFVVPHDDYQLERVHVRDMTPERFFERYVATRTPVVLEGFINDASFSAPSKWTNEYLRAQAGDEIVAVERRGDTLEKFGRGIEVSMPFKDLLALIASGDEMHYLTTQNVEADGDDGRPELMAPFVAKLQHDLPLRPALLGHLVPQNINIWMGNNKDGSSSGLHHDYHDNLYILLRGKKRFRLYSPADAHCMYTRGSLVRVHANGRINYAGEETTAYGADPLSEAAAVAAIEKDDAERELAAAEQDVASAATRDDAAAQARAQQRLEVAEDRLDKAMLALLRVERNEDVDGSEPEDGEFGAFHFDDDDDDEDENEDDDEEEEQEENDKDDAASTASSTTNTTKRIVDKTVKDPANFSRVDTFLLRDAATAETLYQEFPRFQDVNAAWCELRVGEMLYLPASWFHEVESFGSSDGDASGDRGHLALNYWYHPPDALASFEAPYSSPFWPRDWAMRMAAAASNSNSSNATTRHLE